MQLLRTHWNRKTETLAKSNKELVVSISLKFWVIYSLGKRISATKQEEKSFQFFEIFFGKLSCGVWIGVKKELTFDGIISKKQRPLAREVDLAGNG